MPMAVALGIGALLGLVSGVIGIGGGILLSPLLLLFRWADAKTTAATSALFILVNSLAGLAGLWSNGATLDPRMLTWVGVALVGGVAMQRRWSLHHTIIPSSTAVLWMAMPSRSMRT